MHEDGRFNIPVSRTLLCSLELAEPDPSHDLRVFLSFPFEQKWKVTIDTVRNIKNVVANPCPWCTNQRHNLLKDKENKMEIRKYQNPKEIVNKRQGAQTDIVNKRQGVQTGSHKPCFKVSTLSSLVTCNPIPRISLTSRQK